MIGLLVTTVAALLAQSAPASAGTSGNSVTMAPATAPGSVSPVVVPGKKAPEAAKIQTEMVCRSEPVLGTLFPKRICATRQEIAERRRWDQKETREATNLRPWQDEAAAK